MNNLNSILIEGTLTKDAVYRTTAKGTAVSTFSIATNRFYKQDTEMEKEVSFFDVETWAKLAEAVRDKARKGRGVRVIGRLKQDRWIDNEGKNRNKIYIVAEHVEFRPEFKKNTVAEYQNEETEFVEAEENLVATF